MEQVPQNLPDNVREYFARHLGRLELALQNTDQLQRYTSIPAKPSIGKVYYFSNAVGAITSEGAWEYTSTGWVKLGNVGGGGGGGGSGTVTSVSVVTANGVSGSVATPTTTPAITLSLGAITPSSVAATGTVTGSNLAGSNTGDETTATIKTKLGITTLSGSNTGDQTIALTGDVTGTGTGSFVATVSAGAVTLGKMANLAANSIIGNNTGIAATPIALTTAQAKALLAIANTDVSGLGSLATASSVNLSTQATGTLQAAQMLALTGDVTNTAGTVAATIANNAVTNAKAAQMGANTIKGNNTGATANASDLTATQATAMLDLFTTALKGLVPASGGGTANFLRADGTWSAPAGGGGGTTINKGTTTLNFGTFPGATDTSVAVTGQTGIVAGSIVNAWVTAKASTEHTADEHWVENLQVTAGNIVAGTGFTIYGLTLDRCRLYGNYNVMWEWY